MDIMDAPREVARSTVEGPYVESTIPGTLTLRRGFCFSAGEAAFVADWRVRVGGRYGATWDEVGDGDHTETVTWTSPIRRSIWLGLLR